MLVHRDYHFRPPNPCHLLYDVQMRAIKEELGDDHDEDDLVALERKMQSAEMPANIWKHAQRELRYDFLKRHSIGLVVVQLKF